MYQNDYILREIEGMSRFLAKVLFQKDLETEEIVDEQNQVSGAGLFRHMLFQMLSDGKVNDAENLLHESIEADPKPEYLEIALDFYRQLCACTDEELAAANFSREEIAEGLEAVKGYYLAPEGGAPVAHPGH